MSNELVFGWLLFGLEKVEAERLSFVSFCVSLYPLMCFVTLAGHSLDRCLGIDFGL